jgi:hypothetical protein
MAGTGTTSIRCYNYFLDTALVAPGTYVANGPNNFVDPDGTPFLSNTIQIVNDGATNLWFSFDGIADHGRVLPGEALTQDFRRERRIWFRGTTGSAYRFWAY